MTEYDPNRVAEWQAHVKQVQNIAGEVMQVLQRGLDENQGLQLENTAEDLPDHPTGAHDFPSAEVRVSRGDHLFSAHIGGDGPTNEIGCRELSSSIERVQQVIENQNRPTPNMLARTPQPWRDRLWEAFEAFLRANVSS